MNQAKFHKVPSQSQPDVEYTVIERPDGTWSCSCPAHAFRNKECKHIQQIKLGSSSGKTQASASKPERDVQIMPPAPITPEKPKSEEIGHQSPHNRQEKRYGKDKLTWGQIMERMRHMGKRAQKADQLAKDVQECIVNRSDS